MKSSYSLVTQTMSQDVMETLSGKTLEAFKKKSLSFEEIQDEAIALLQIYQGRVQIMNAQNEEVVMYTYNPKYTDNCVSLWNEQRLNEFINEHK